MRPCAMIAMAIALSAPASGHAPRNPVIGVWLVEQPAAPFPLHLYVFNADGTMQQANPDAGDPHTSDSDGKGVWAQRGGRVVGKWVEIIADRATHKLAGRGELSFDLVVTGDRLAGTGMFFAYDPAGHAVAGPIAAPFTGSRVTAP